MQYISGVSAAIALAITQLKELIVPSLPDSDICHLLAGPVGTASEGGGLLLWEGKSH